MTSFKQVYKVLPRYENGQAQAGVALKSTGGTPFKALSHISRENRECIVIIKDNKSNNLKGSDYIYESDWNNTKSEERCLKNEQMPILHQFGEEMKEESHNQ